MPKNVVKQSYIQGYNMFKIGQIITGTPQSDTTYGVTTSSAIMQVIGFMEDNYIEVKVLSFKTSEATEAFLDSIGNTYTVHTSYFKPYKQFIFTRTTQCQELQDHENLVSESNHTDQVTVPESSVDFSASRRLRVEDLFLARDRLTSSSTGAFRRQYTLASTSTLYQPSVQQSVSSRPYEHSLNPAYRSLSSANPNQNQDDGLPDWYLTATADREQ